MRKEENSGPLVIFGIRLKTIVFLTVFSALLLVVMNRGEIESLLEKAGIDQRQPPPSPAPTEESSAPVDIVVDRDMLSRAMREVQAEKLAEVESGDSSVPTDRFFYVVELVSGSDLEGVELTIEADRVIIVSEGGTETTIPRTAVKDIQRFKLPPTPQH